VFCDAASVAQERLKGWCGIVEFTLSTASLFNFELREVFRLASEVGFHGIELMVTNRGETQSKDRLAELIDLYHLPVRSIHAPFLLAAKKVWGDPVSKIERSVDMAHALHSEVVVVHLPYFWQWSYARWAHRNLNAFSKSCGVTIAVENAMLVNLWRPINLSLFNSMGEIKHFDNITFDTSHYAIAGVDILQAWEELKDQAVHVHLSNNYMKGFDDHALPFEGRLPLDKFLGLLRRDGFEGKIVLELGPGPLETRLGEDRILFNLRRSLEYCIDCYGE
jgi:sugar phosphate isomerase/epimerase